jgi:polysaccharide export outer membrane protein
MNIRRSLHIVAAGALALSGCSTPPPSTLASGAEAYKMIPDVPDGLDQGAIQPGDRLAVRVMGEPDLTSDQIWVDGGGKVQLPLAGEVVAGGRAPGDVQKEITEKLASRYIRDPQVAISIVEHAKFSITVEGEVQHAGRFEASPGLTLLGALAMAQSTTSNARLDEVVVFRQLHGQRLAGRFDLRNVRVGRAPDPQIFPGDVIVVGRSWVKGSWHDLLQAAPLFNIFYVFRV